MKNIFILLLSLLLLTSCDANDAKKFNILHKPLILESKLYRITKNWSSCDTIVTLVFKDDCKDIYLFKYNTEKTDNDNQFFKYLHYKYRVNDTIK
jgi:uncharacterized protein YcfL